MSVLVVGSVAFDAIETPFGKTDKIVGGSGTYICMAATHFVNNINLVAVVGDDFPGEEIGKFIAMGVNTEGLQIKKGEKSFFWAGRYHIDMNTRDTLVTELNVLENFDPVIPESYQNCEYLILGNLSPEVQSTVIGRLNTRPTLIVMDTMNFWIENTNQILKETLSKIDVLSINDEEARQLSGEYSLVRAARAILDMGPRYLVIKKGEHGALLFDDEQVFFAPALPLEEVFDPTGAGDTFAGGFIGYLARTQDHSFKNMKRAVIHGSAMASFCVEKFGVDRLLELKQPVMDKRIRDFIDLVQFEIEYK